jgi:peptidoglycan/LPS O-acetylase OafA/YrhL
MKKIDPLTSTRFIAASFFLLYHIRAMEIPFIKPLTDLAPYMISFFFVLSGFVMTLVYYKPGKRFNYRDFWVARVSRIYPIHLLSLALACVHYADALSKINPLEYFSAVFLFQAWIPQYALTFNFPAWTLAVEMFFYLLFPFLVHFAVRHPLRRMIWISLGIWAVNQIFRQVLIHAGFDVDTAFIAYFPLLHLDAFLLGLIGGIWFLIEGKKTSINPTINLLFMLVSTGIVLFLATVFNIGSRLGAINGFFSPLFVVIILTLCFDQTLITRFLSQRWLVRLGESSYSLYIFHIPVLWIISDVLLKFGIVPSPLILLVSYVPFMIGLSVIIFRQIEWPAQKRLRANPQKIVLVVIDLVLIAAALALSFALRVGFNVNHYTRSIQFATRVGVPLAFILLVLFGFYKPAKDLKRFWFFSNLVIPLLLSLALLGAAMFFGMREGWIESFPRTYPVISLVFTTGMLYLSRLAFRRWKPSWVA